MIEALVIIGLLVTAYAFNMLPRVTRNHDGNILVIWLGMRWERTYSGKWERVL